MIFSNSSIELTKPVASMTIHSLFSMNGLALIQTGRAFRHGLPIKRL
jgi:hypothetical protein